MWRVVADLLRDIVSYGGVKNDPLYKRMQDALKKIQEGNLRQTEGMVMQLKQTLANRAKAYMAYRNEVPNLVEVFEDLSLQYEEILKALKTNDPGEATAAITKFIEIMDKNSSKIEQDIKKVQ
jgi:predicted negative regulator of RcsB-dependent stress response